MSQSFRNGSEDKTKNGFSLIEVMMATFLVGVLGAGVVSGTLTARRLTFLNAQRVAAFGLAKAKIEETKGVGFEELSNRYGTDQQEIGLELVNLGGVDQQIIAAERVTQMQDLTNPVRKQVTVLIRWDFQGTEIQETVQTYLYPRR